MEVEISGQVKHTLSSGIDYEMETCQGITFKLPWEWVQSKKERDNKKIIKNSAT